MRIEELDTIARRASRKMHAVFQGYGWPLTDVPKISPGLVKIVLDTANKVRQEMICQAKEE